jgi:hypothetical protein
MCFRTVRAQLKASSSEKVNLWCQRPGAVREFRDRRALDQPHRHETIGSISAMERQHQPLSQTPNHT